MDADDVPRRTPDRKPPSGPAEPKGRAPTRRPHPPGALAAAGVAVLLGVAAAVAFLEFSAGAGPSPAGDDDVLAGEQSGGLGAAPLPGGAEGVEDVVGGSGSAVGNLTSGAGLPPLPGASAADGGSGDPGGAGSGVTSSSAPPSGSTGSGGPSSSSAGSSSSSSGLPLPDVEVPELPVPTPTPTLPGLPGLG